MTNQVGVYAPWGDELFTVSPVDEHHIGSIITNCREEHQIVIESAAEYLARQGHGEAAKLLTQFF